MKRSGRIACGIVLSLISLVALSSDAQASGGIQSMTPAVGQGEMFLELEVISVKRSQIHRTFHNGIKKLIRNDVGSAGGDRLYHRDDPVPDHHRLHV